MTWTDSAWMDARFAARMLARRPVFSIAAALTLALGIASATAMFSLVDGILLRPLPYPNASDLVEVMQAYPEKGLDRWTLSQQNVATYRDRATSFSAFAAHVRSGVTLDENGVPQRLIVEFVTGDFFKVMGVAPLFGRTLTRDDDVPNNSGFAVLSFAFWQSHFGGTRDIVGKTIQIDGPVRVIGVMPADFTFPKPDVQLYLALGLEPARAHPNFLSGVARLKPGMSVDRAQREMTSLMWNWARTSPGMLATGVEPRQTRMRALVTPLRDAMTASVTRQLNVLQAAVMLILLIAIANVAMLLSSRGAARSRELATRATLGASTARLGQQVLTESLMLAAIGGVLGILGARLLVSAFLRSNLVVLPRAEEVSMNASVLMFALTLMTLSGMLFGLAPAIRTRRFALVATLGGTKSSAGAGERRFNNWLVAAQVGLSFVLLVSAGLVLESFQRLLATNLGFEANGVTSISMAVPGQRYLGARNQPRQIAFVEDVLARTNAMAGVTSAAIMWPPMYVNDVNTDTYRIEGPAPTSPSGSETQTVQYSISPGLFRTLRIPMLYGRDFNASDRTETAPVIIIDKALARMYWKGGDALGKRLLMTGDRTWRTIVGVVGSIRDESVASEARPHTYFPYAQQVGSRPTLMIRSAAGTATAIEAAKRAIAAVDPSVPIDNVHPVTGAISQSLRDRRATELLLIGFAALALLLGACGLYGVMSLHVASRNREFGIRAAIGAPPSRLLRIVLLEGLGLVGAGVIAGIVASALTTRALRSLLYEVPATDPTVYSAVGGMLMLVAASACYLPARRAARADPLLALRAE